MTRFGTVQLGFGLKFGEPYACPLRFRQAERNPIFRRLPSQAGACLGLPCRT